VEQHTKVKQKREGGGDVKVKKRSDVTERELVEDLVQ